MTKKMFMLSMFDISLPAANAIYTWANVLLVVGAVSALVGTLGVFWIGGIRERYSDERIASNEAETARAKAEAAKAQLETERLKVQLAWRRLSPNQYAVLVTSLKGKIPEGIWIETVGSDPEASELHADIAKAFKDAGIAVHTFTGWERTVGVGIANGHSASRQAVLSAFNSIGVVLDEHKSGMSKSNDKVEIIVGSKPPPVFPQSNP
ncbi:MAG: hypothetical protein HGB06_05225 [Chlorobaculum sp.]|jgi:hypothetical protein|nr:hypothetical protein [Chlorobaculum sp.]